ncbi:hypothetical protein AEQ67_29450 [Pseudomonas sp. RIT-PI-q]|nr:hypothetical protein AEQ67_29450 [Pseudomonas sp. RIT-PI-q]
MVVNDNAGCLTPRGALGFIASKLAPTGIGIKVLLERFIEGKLRAGFVVRQPWLSCNAGQLGPN